MRLAAALFLLLQDDPAKLIESYARLDLESRAKGEREKVEFDATSRDRTLIEHRLVASGKAAVKPLAGALKSDNRHMRAASAWLLGVLGDASAGPALAAAASDKDPIVRSMAIQSLAWLRAGADAIKAAEKDANPNVRFIAQRAQEQLKADPKLRDAFAALKPEELGSAQVGKPAPDFTLPAAGGGSWKLSDRKGLVVLMFQLADW